MPASKPQRGEARSGARTPMLCRPTEGPRPTAGGRCTGDGLCFMLRPLPWASPPPTLRKRPPIGAVGRWPGGRLRRCSPGPGGRLGDCPPCFPSDRGPAPALGTFRPWPWQRFALFPGAGGRRRGRPHDRPDRPPPPTHPPFACASGVRGGNRSIGAVAGAVQPRMRAPSASNSTSVMTFACRFSPRISISTGRPGRALPSGRKPIATDLPDQCA